MKTYECIVTLFPKFGTAPYVEQHKDVDATDIVDAVNKYASYTGMYLPDVITCECYGLSETSCLFSCEHSVTLIRLKM